jgi:hypothetical protein
MGTNRDGLVGLMTVDCFKITDGPDINLPISDVRS